MPSPGDILNPPAPIPNYLPTHQPSNLVGSATNGILVPGWPEISDPKPLRPGLMTVTDSLREGIGLYDALLLALRAVMSSDRRNMTDLKDEARHKALLEMTDSLIANQIADCNTWRQKTLTYVATTIKAFTHTEAATDPIEAMMDIELRRYVAERPSPLMFLTDRIRLHDTQTIRAVLRAHAFLSGLTEDDLLPARQSMVSVNVAAKLASDRTYRDPLGSLRALTEGTEHLRLLEFRGLESILRVSRQPGEQARILREHCWLPDADLLSLVRDLSDSKSALPVLQTLAEPEIRSSLAA